MMTSAALTSAVAWPVTMYGFGPLTGAGTVPHQTTKLTLTYDRCQPGQSETSRGTSKLPQRVEKAEAELDEFDSQA